jgi:hypothetical protein
VIKQKVEIKANAIIKHDLKNNKRKQINKDLTQMAKATLA